MNEYGNIFYKSYCKHNKYKITAHNHSNVPKVYYAPIFYNILSIHLLSAFSSDSDLKYLTSGIQQPFVPVPGSCIFYQPHRDFSVYLANSGIILVMAEISKAIDFLIPEHFHLPLYM